MYCVDKEHQWDEGVHLVLFAAHESIQEALGFSPFELVFAWMNSLWPTKAP